MQMLRAMNPEAPSRPAGLPHAVFLQRVADEPATSPEVRLGQGAFLALRFVDLLAPDREAPTPDVFRYQWAATERYCAELAGEGTEASHLSGIVRATGEAHATGDIRLIGPALFAYALYLEQESHFEEAEDVLQTMINIGHERIRVTDQISAWMRLGRVRRLQADFDRADASYAEARKIAAQHGDRVSVLLSRVGQCNVLYFRGNLPEAEQNWRSVLADAANAGFQRAQAEAEHGLGTTLHRRGQPHEGAPHLWRAYQLYEDSGLKLRVLNDLGIVLLQLGDAEGAERALREVVRQERDGENLTNALIELMHCASFRRDRVGFERWRERCLDGIPNAPANVRGDYHFKTGIGFARFGNYRRSRDELRKALEVAAAHDLHEFEFRVERILKGVAECGAPDEAECAAYQPPIVTESLREVAASLVALGT